MNLKLPAPRDAYSETGTALREDVTDKRAKDSERRINVAYDRIKAAFERATKP